MNTTSQKSCRRCLALKPMTDFHALKSRLDGRKSYCKACIKTESAKRYANNPDHRKVVNAAWRDKNPEKMGALRIAWAANNKERMKAVSAAWYRAKAAAGNDMSAWRKANPEKHSVIKSIWRKKNKDTVNANTAARHARKLRATPPWANIKEIKSFYEAAFALSKVTGKSHHVDHIVPLRSDLVCGLHVSNNLQVLTGIENMSKGNHHWPDMP